MVAQFSGSTVSSSKVVLGHVATHPIRAGSVESAINGKTLTESVIGAAAAHATDGSSPLTHLAVGANGNNQNESGNNKFRQYILVGAVTNALRSLPSASPGVQPPTATNPTTFTTSASTS